MTPAAQSQPGRRQGGNGLVPWVLTLALGAGVGAGVGLMWRNPGTAPPFVQQVLGPTGVGGLTPAGVARMSAVLTAMPHAAAARVLLALPPKVAASVLTRLPVQKQAALLAAVPTRDAAVLLLEMGRAKGGNRP